MAAYITIGSDSNSAPDCTTQLVVATGDTVTVANNTNSTGSINYLSGGFTGAVTGTIAANASHNFTIVGTHYLNTANRADLKITGGRYGV